MTRKKHFLLLALLFVALLPLMCLRDFTPDNELRYLSIADEALREGHFFAFTSHGAPYADKPPLYLWIVMLCRAVAGRHLLPLLGLFSLLPALGVLRAMDRWVGVRMADRDARAGMLTLASSAFFLGAAVVLRMDMLMCLFIVLALRVFWRMYEGRARRGDTMRFPAYVFLALFTKGPVGLLVPLVSVVVFLLLEGRLRTLGRYWGWRTWGVILAGCLVWFGAVYAEGGREYLDNLLFHQTIDRAVDAFHHKAPVYYYLVAIWYALAPWSPWMVASVVAALVCRKVGEALPKFLLTVFLTTLVMLSAFSSKLQIYLLPAFPFLAYFAAWQLPWFGRTRLAWWCMAVPALLLAFALPLLILTQAAELLTLPVSAPLYLAAGLLTAGGLVAMFRLLRGSDAACGVAPVVAGLFAALFAGAFALPSLNPMIGYGDLCRQASEVVRAEGLPVRYSTYRIRRSENMDVYLGVPPRAICDADSLAEVREGVVLARRRDLGHDPALDRFVGRAALCRKAGEYLIVIPADPAGGRPAANVCGGPEDTRRSEP